MNPVMQTVLGRHGNCYSACLASLFEIPLDQVPNFFDVAGDDDSAWWGEVRSWLRARGFGVITVLVDENSRLDLFDGWFIVGGESCRGIGHATIWRDGQLVHDPHPSKCGIIKADSVDLLYPLDPSKLMIRGSL